MFKKSEEKIDVPDKIEIIELVSLGLLENVKALIETGCDVNQADRYGNRAVLMAALRNDMEILKELIKAGARLDVEDHYHHSPRSWAEENGSDEMVRLIDATIKSYPKNK